MKNLNLLLISVVVMVGLGGFLAIGLSFAYRKLKVEEDPRLKKILEALPGLNCGVCGYASCEDFARNLMEGKAPVDGCKAGGANVAGQLQGILGKGSSEGKEIRKARLKCNARESQKIKIVDYRGLKTCLAADNLGSSGFSCFDGCLGLGDCVKICPVSAIKMTEGRPQINLSKCIGCGLCVKACPRGLIDIVVLKRDTRKLVIVGCNSTQGSAATRKMCEAGCIACGKCVKVCPVDAIKIENFKAIIDHFKCIACGKCVEACPTRAIYMTEVVPAK